MRGGTFLLLCLLLPSGCGYRVQTGTLPGYQTVAVPIVENRTLRRDLEFELTRIITREVMASTSYQIVERDRADLVIEGEILEYVEPNVVEGDLGQKVEGGVQLRFRLKVLGKKGLIHEQETVKRASVVGRRNENERTGRSEAFHEVAKWVVEEIESPW